jgi:hypothetical protein
MLAEAYRRGLLPPRMASDYEAAARQGAVNDPYAAARAAGRGQPVTGYLTTAARAVPGVTELGAGWSAALQSAADLANGRKADFGARWNQARAQQQGLIDQFRADHPIAANNAAALGTVAPMAATLPLGAAPAAARLAAPVAAKGAAAVAGRIATAGARNAFTGGVIGATYGFGQSGSLQDRAASAARGFLPGAVAGVALPGAVGAARGLLARGRVLASGAPGLAGLVDGNVAPAAEAAPIEDATGAADGADSGGPSVHLDPATAEARSRILDAFNRAVANRGLEPFGETLPNDVPTGREAAAFVGKRVAKAYDDAAAGVHSFSKDDALIADTQRRGQMLVGRPAYEYGLYRQVLKDMVAEPLYDGELSGDDVLDMQNRLAEVADEFKRDEAYTTDVGRSIDGLNDDITNAVDRQNPGYAKAKRAADEAAAVHIRLARASDLAADAGGVFTPDQLRAAADLQDADQGNIVTASSVLPLRFLADHADRMLSEPHLADIDSLSGKTPAELHSGLMFLSGDPAATPVSTDLDWSEPNAFSGYRPPRTQPTFDPRSMGWNAIAPAGIMAGSILSPQNGQAGPK